MNEEFYVREKLGQKNPFRVPEGYFDSFVAQTMAVLPERQAHTVSLRPLRAVMYAAACLFVAIFSIGVYFAHLDSSAPVSASVSDSFIDDVADYAMLDNAEIYACLSDN